MISIALREKNATVILTFWYYTYIYECADTYTNHSVSKFDPNWYVYDSTDLHLIFRGPDSNNQFEQHKKKDMIKQLQIYKPIKYHKHLKQHKQHRIKDLITQFKQHTGNTSKNKKQEQEQAYKQECDDISKDKNKTWNKTNNTITTTQTKINNHPVWCVHESCGWM